MTRASLYLLAALGALLVAVGEVCGIEARRGRWVDVVGSAAFLGAYWTWRTMQPWQGVSRPAGVWTALAALVWLALSAVYREDESVTGRGLFVVGMLAFAAREAFRR